MLAFAAYLVPVVFGREPDALFFGLGGYFILCLVVVILWLWRSYRVRLSKGRRLAVDLQIGGLLCFAVASWNLCGVGDMPSFALWPEKMLLLDTRGFAIGQLKSVMILLLSGWLLTAMGLFSALRVGSRGIEEPRS